MFSFALHRVRTMNFDSKATDRPAKFFLKANLISAPIVKFVLCYSTYTCDSCLVTAGVSMWKPLKFFIFKILCSLLCWMS